MSVGGRRVWEAKELWLWVKYEKGNEWKLHDTMIVYFFMSCVAREEKNGKCNENGMKFHYFVLDFFSPHDAAFNDNITYENDMEGKKC